MSIIDAYTSVLSQYCVFRGRTRRRIYWGFVLVNTAMTMIISIIDSILFNGSNIPGLLYTLAVFLPGLGAMIRRLHDSGRSAWWMFLLFIPVIGFVVLVIILCLDSQPESNDWGVNPKEKLFFSGE